MTATSNPALIDALIAAGSASERRAVIVGAGLADPEGIAWLVGQSAELIQNDPATAEAIAEACAAVADDIEAHEIGANARYQQARLLANRGEPAQALELIDAARCGYDTAGNELAATRTELGRMHVLDDFGQHIEAAETGERALIRLQGIRVDKGDVEFSDWMRAAIQENLGVAYGYTDAHDRALAAYATAEFGYAALGMTGDLARVRANRGVELVEIGRAGEGLALLNTSAVEFLGEDNLVWHFKCLGHAAEAHMMLGSYVDALALLEEARGGLEQLGAVAEATRLISTLADASLALSLHHEALELAGRASAVFRDAGMTHDLAKSMQRCGVAALRAGDADAAVGYLEAARRHFIEVAASASANETSLALAEVLHSTGSHAQALALTIDAVEDLTAGDSPARLALALMHLADLSAPPHDEDALRRATVLVEELDLPPLRHPLHLRLGRMHRRNGDLVRARLHLQSAVDIIEVLQGTVSDESLRAVFLGDKRQAVDELADLLLTLATPDVAAAFDVCERARSRTLMELLAGGSAAPAISVDDTEDQQSRVGRELNAIYNTMVSIDGPGRRGRLHALHERATTLERELTLLRIRQAGSMMSQPVTVSAPAKAADDLTTIVVYEVLGDTVNAFVLTPDGVSHCRLADSTTSVLETLDDLDEQWAMFQFGSEFGDRHATLMQATARSTLARLHEQLIEPITGLVGDATRPMTIVPTGELFRVPFAALFDGTSHLIDQRPLTMAPSVHLAQRGLRDSSFEFHQAKVLVMGISDEATPCAEQEARRVAAMVADSHLFLGEDATVDRFREFAPTCDLIHLACHGLHRADNPLFSAVRLADGWLSAREIMRLPLSGATVVLSACASGRQASGRGEPIGLSWAFLAAGAVAVIGSLWSVQDNVTAELMSSFYRHLARGSSHAEALRSAQRDARAEWPHPYHWASFFLIGSVDSK